MYLSRSVRVYCFVLPRCGLALSLTCNYICDKDGPGAEAAGSASWEPEAIQLPQGERAPPPSQSSPARSAMRFTALSRRVCIACSFRSFVSSLPHVHHSASGPLVRISGIP